MESPGRTMKKGIFDITSSCRIVYFQFNVMIIGVWLVVIVRTVKAHKKIGLYTHKSISCDNNAMMGAFYCTMVEREKP